MGEAEKGKNSSPHESFRYCRYTTERSPLPMVAVEGLTHIVRYVNPAFCLLADKRREVLIGCPFAEAVPEKEENGCIALLDRVYRTGEAENLAEQKHTSLAASPVYWSYAVWAILDADECPSGVMIQITDTTEVARYRLMTTAMNAKLILAGIEQNKLTEKAEKLNVRLQRAILETHHRVKNNLQIVAALAEVQIDNESLTIPTAALQRIATHVGTLANLHDLLTQKIKADSGDETLDAEVILTPLIALLEASAGMRRFHCTIVPVPLPFADSAALAMLVSELVSNSIKHGKGQINVSLQREGDEAHLTVGDEGHGFPADFDPSSAANTGLELILSIARHDLRGKIEFANNPTGGACVRVRFPLRLLKPS